MKTFAIDNRDNPKLHKLHVTWAIEDLSLFRDVINACNSTNRLNPAIVAGKIQSEITYLVSSNAAYFEAAALLFGNCDLSEYLDKVE